MGKKKWTPKPKERISSKNVALFKDAKVLKTMKKEGSYDTIGFFSFYKDDFMIEVVKYKTKKGTLVEHNTIIEKDMKRWIEIYEKEGFK